MEADTSMSLAIFIPNCSTVFDGKLLRDEGRFDFPSKHTLVASRLAPETIPVICIPDAVSFKELIPVVVFSFLLFFFFFVSKGKFVVDVAKA